MKPAKYGFELTVRGYTSKMIKFVQDIISTIYSMEFNQVMQLFLCKAFQKIYVYSLKFSILCPPHGWTLGSNEPLLVASNCL